MTIAITDSNRRGDGGRHTTGLSFVAVAVAGRRQVRDAPAWTRLISSAQAPPDLLVSGPVAVGWPVAVTSCCPMGTLCPSASAIPTESSAKTAYKLVYHYN